MTSFKNYYLKETKLRPNITKSIQESTKTIQDLVKLIPQIEESIIVIVDCLSKGKKVILFGNGGSAADAQHIAAEFIGRFKLERQGYPAIASRARKSHVDWRSIFYKSIGNCASYPKISPNWLQTLGKRTPNPIYSWMEICFIL